MSNPLFYVVGYLTLMLPTYVLPYFGSNSTIVNGLGAAVGRGMTPFWWLHVWALVMLVLMAFARGKHLGKTYIVVFPVIAAAFDMVPGLSLVPFVPTVMHLVALVLGAMGHVQTNVVAGGSAEDVPKPSSNGVAISALLMTFATILGSLWFALNTTNTVSSTRAPQSVTPQPVPAPTPAPTLDLKQGKAAESEAATKTPSALPPRPKPQKVTTKPSTEGGSPQAETQEKLEPPKKSRYINLND
jgi:hypothetical protein